MTPFVEPCARDHTNYGQWRSLVARFVRDEEVGSSNLPCPTPQKADARLRTRQSRAMSAGSDNCHGSTVQSVAGWFTDSDRRVCFAVRGDTRFLAVRFWASAVLGAWWQALRDFTDVNALHALLWLPRMLAEWRSSRPQLPRPLRSRASRCSRSARSRSSRRIRSARSRSSRSARSRCASASERLRSASSCRSGSSSESWALRSASCRECSVFRSASSRERSALRSVSCWERSALRSSRSCSVFLDSSPCMIPVPPHFGIPAAINLAARDDEPRSAGVWCSRLGVLAIRPSFPVGAQPPARATMIRCRFCRPFVERSTDGSWSTIGSTSTRFAASCRNHSRR